MRRITFWLLSSLSALVLLFGYHTSTAGPLAADSPSAVVTAPAAGTSSSSKAGTGSSSTSPSTTGSGTDGTTLTGEVASTQWGPVQVRLTMQGGAITDVTVLQHPDGNPKDSEINSYALPILIQETEQSGDANIDMVSGATVTSTGYLQSLQSALDQANA
jgi:uncharacterized protein with FMN-binding domain